MSENLKELEDVIVFGFDGLDTYRLVVADKRLDLTDLRYLWPLYSSAKAAIENIGNPVDRFLALSKDEKAQLFVLVDDRFDIEDDEKELLIEDTIKAVVVNIELAQRWGNRRKVAA